MTFGESVSTCFSKYATFTGRASRSEYWWWALFTFLIDVAASVVGAAAFGFGVGHDAFSTVVSWAFFLPSLAVLMRRLHDTGKCGWWWLISLIPLAGIIALIIMLVQPSEPTPNKYGVPPMDTVTE